MTVRILKTIAEHGLRIFEKPDIIALSKEMGISTTYVSRALSNMSQKGDIIALGQGLYSLPVELLAGGPLHSFEIGLKLAKKGSISYRSAMSYYNLTDQVSNTVYITVPKEKGANLSRYNQYKLNGVLYKLIRVSPKNYWGIKREFIGEASILITDLEKTIIDSLSNPRYCGGMREVLFGVENAIDKISPQKIVDYAQRTSIAVCKRLGWILDSLNCLEEAQTTLQNMTANQYQKLDPHGERQGKYNKRWMILENI